MSEEFFFDLRLLITPFLAKLIQINDHSLHWLCEGFSENSGGVKLFYVPNCIIYNFTFYIYYIQKQQLRAFPGDR